MSRSAHVGWRVWLYCLLVVVALVIGHTAMRVAIGPESSHEAGPLAASCRQEHPRWPCHARTAASTSGRDREPPQYSPATLAGRDDEAIEIVAALEAAISDHGPDSRAEAIGALALRADTAAIAALATALDHHDPDTRLEAVEALGDLDGRLVPAYLARSLWDPDEHVRHAAVEAVAAQGGQDAVVTLGALLESRDPALRALVVDALGEIGGPQAGPLLIRASVDSHESVRRAADDWLRHPARQ